MRISDWSSDVCSSDLGDKVLEIGAVARFAVVREERPERDGGRRLPYRGEAQHGGIDPAIESIREIIGLNPVGHLANLLVGEHQPAEPRRLRSDERRVGKEWGSKSRSRWYPDT